MPGRCVESTDSAETSVYFTGTKKIPFSFKRRSTVSERKLTKYDLEAPLV